MRERTVGHKVSPSGLAHQRPDRVSPGGHRGGHDRRPSGGGDGGRPAAAHRTAASGATSSAAADDAFHVYDGSRPLSSYEPGDVLKTRTLRYHVEGVPTPLKAIQLLYRSTDAQGRPSANVTTVVRSITGDSGKAVSYQSFYDSLNPADGPSRPSPVT